ncbi:hypothetical protein [Rhodococcus sp. NPDC127528]|uniref:hypothetical protein n=1 Tax=unclassified Rhodococcus (in: high G+C Gram-positive bacteria) TaxID=192944 RepID=UPI00363A0F60
MGSFGKGESVQVDECRLVEAGSDVAACQDEGDRQSPLTAPVETIRSRCPRTSGGDPVQAADTAPQIGVHACVVQAQVERADPVGLCHSLFDGEQVVTDAVVRLVSVGWPTKKRGRDLVRVRDLVRRSSWNCWWREVRVAWSQAVSDSSIQKIYPRFPEN